MGIMHKMMDFLGLAGEGNDIKGNRQDELEYEEDAWFDEDELNSKKKNKMNTPPNVVSLQTAKQQSKMILVEPRTYEESQELADHLRSRRAIVVNLHHLHLDEAKRVVDFLSGTVYAIGGDIQKIGTNIFLCTPDNVEIQGSITEMIEDEFQSRMR